MEMVLQQRASGGGVVAACRAGPTPTMRLLAATAPMMAKQERPEEADDDEQEEEEEQLQLQQQQRAAAAAAAAGEELLRRGPWTVDEDLTLVNYIADHGEGRWNALARAAGLKRTGKSCRLRWLNYLRPDVKRGDFTADEQLLILDLHSRWGNRWSKIASQLPGRTDNEIKNYWRTRVQKHAKQLGCDVNSTRFKDAMRFLWMPRLAERAKLASIQSPSPGMAAAAPPSSSSSSSSAGCSSCSSLTTESTAYDDGAAWHTAAVVEVEPAAAAAAVAAVAGDDDYCWVPAATTTTMQQNDDFWSTASALQHLTAGDHQQLQQLAAAADEQDLTGWVQGFSDGGILSGSPSDSLWSLDDIWRMH